MQSQPTAGVVPVHHQIADSLRSRIESRELVPGDSLPTAKALCEQWGCAPATARSALAVLRGEGRITGGRGKAPVVRTPPKRIKLSQEGRQAQKDLVLRPEEERANTGASELHVGVPISQLKFAAKYETVPADKDLADEFDVSAGTDLLRRVYETTDTETDHRVLWSVSYIPRSLIESNSDLLDESNEPWPGGHQHQLYTVGIEVDRFENSVIAMEPTTRERQEWGMEAGVPMLHLRSRSVDTDSRVVELSESKYPADRTEVTFTERLKRWED